MGTTRLFQVNPGQLVSRWALKTLPGKPRWAGPSMGTTKLLLHLFHNKKLWKVAELGFKGWNQPTVGVTWEKRTSTVIRNVEVTSIANNFRTQRSQPCVLNKSVHCLLNKDAAEWNVLWIIKIILCILSIFSVPKAKNSKITSQVY